MPVPGNPMVLRAPRDLLRFIVRPGASLIRLKNRNPIEHHPVLGGMGTRPRTDILRLLLRRYSDGSTTRESVLRELETIMQEVFGPDWSSARIPSPIPAWEPEHLTPEDEQAIQERCECDERFDELCRGDTSRYDDDDSRADQAFCNILRNILGPSPPKIEAAVRASGLYREKRVDLPRFRGHPFVDTLSLEGRSP
jgi:hypothetical protein